MADRPDELFLIDGNSLVYRAFFALLEYGRTVLRRAETAGQTSS